MKTRQTLLELVQLRGDVLLKLVIILFLAQIAVAQHHTAAKARQSSAAANVHPALKLTIIDEARIRLNDGRQLSIPELSGELAGLTNQTQQMPIGVYLEAPGRVSAQALYDVLTAVQNAGGTAYVSLIGGAQ
jgi:biopolymer transport protein ExbD